MSSASTPPPPGTLLRAGLLLLPLAVPTLWSLWAAMAAAWELPAWRAALADGQTLRALALSLWTGLAGTALAIGSTHWIVSRTFATGGWPRGVRWVGAMLAVPHAAFAIGLVAWIAPSGWMLRALSPWATGWQDPPPWPTTQDPWGLGLIAVLAFKETPFLLWAAAALLQQPDAAQRLRRELALAHTLGYDGPTAWWRVAMPQWAPRMAAPALAVLAYSLTVVDMALVIGPSTPPTLAVLAWQWLQDADPAVNAKGAVAAWPLAAVFAAVAAALWAVLQAPAGRRRRSSGPAATSAVASSAGASAARCLTTALAGIYAAVFAALLAGSVTGAWPFPELLPQRWTTAAWASVVHSAPALGTTLWLAGAGSLAALVWVVAWLEWAPPWLQWRVRWLFYTALVLPAVLWVLGLHRMGLQWGLDGRPGGVWLAHTLACLPYVQLALAGPYASFDSRMAALATALGRSPGAFLWQVKWPLLRAALWSAFAVGFAVSVAQYLPTLYLGAGRFATVTTEAVNLAAGGQRSLSAAYAWLQWLLPVLVFAGAALLGRPRRFAPWAKYPGALAPRIA